MPQPLSKIRKSAAYLMGHYYLLQRPDLAAMVTQAICAWSSVEAMTGMILAGMLGAKSRPAVSMYLALSSSSAQRDALSAAAKAVLDDTRLELFQAVFMLAKPWAKRRNNFVHGTWGVSPQLPDHLLWSDPADNLESTVRRSETIEEWLTTSKEWWKNPGPGPQPLPTSNLPDLSKIIAYSREDLVKTLEQFNRVFGHMHSLQMMVNQSHGGYDRALHWLSNEPDVQVALGRLRKRQKTPPSE